MHERIVSNFKKCCSLQDQCNEIKKFGDSSNNKIDKLNLKMTAISNNLKEKMEEINDNYDNTGRILFIKFLILLSE